MVLGYSSIVTITFSGGLVIFASQFLNRWWGGFCVVPRYFLSVVAGGCHFANAGPGIGWGGLCLVLLLLLPLCPNTADAQLTLFEFLVENNLPQETEALDRPDGVGLFSGYPEPGDPGLL